MRVDGTLPETGAIRGHAVPAGSLYARISCEPSTEGALASGQTFPTAPPQLGQPHTDRGGWPAAQIERRIELV